MKRLSPTQIYDIIQLYISGTPSKDIAAQFKIYSNSISRILRRHHIPRNQRHYIDPAIVPTIIQQYLQHQLSSTKIAANFSINPSTVLRLLQRHHIPCRSPEINKRHYIINQDYFAQINTPDKAYFLGFLYADGNLSSSRYAIRLVLHPQDHHILQQFSLAIYDKIKIDSYIVIKNNVSRQYLFTPIYSKKMMQDLILHGCPPRKTFTITFPTFLEPSLLSHFVRGYFDGDGSISFSRHNKPVVDFSSNMIFLGGLRQLLVSQSLICSKVYSRRKNAASGFLQLTGASNIVNFHRWLYQDSTLFLPRKFNLFRRLLK